MTPKSDRPRKAQTKVIHVRLTDDELKQLVLFSDNEKLSRSGFIRLLLKAWKQGQT